MANNNNNNINNNNFGIVGAAIGLGALVGAGLALWTTVSQESELQAHSSVTFEENEIQPDSGISNTMSSEKDLKSYVKRNIWRILDTEDIPELIDEEWLAPSAHTGRGDLVYHCDGIDYVIELKWIDYDGLNDPYRNRETVKTSNRQKRNEVQEQALRYGNIWLTQSRRPFNVKAMAIINSVDDDVHILKQENLSRQRTKSRKLVIGSRFANLSRSGNPFDVTGDVTSSSPAITPSSRSSRGPVCGGCGLCSHCI